VIPGGRGAGDDLGGLAEVTAIDLAPDALFELGIEGKRHRDKLPLHRPVRCHLILVDQTQAVMENLKQKRISLFDIGQYIYHSKVLGEIPVVQQSFFHCSRDDSGN
jgi:hypothetical protein